MSRSASTLARVVGPAAAAAALLLGSLPVSAQTVTTTSSSSDCSEVRFELANPSPGSFLEPGGYVVEGIAMDTRATEGNGIDRIDFFLGNRDLGGTNVGSAVLGETVGPFGAGSFHTTITLPNLTGGSDLFGYAHSSVTDQEIIISVPVAIGKDPVVAGQTSANGATPTMTETCTPMPGTQPMTEEPAPTMPDTTTPPSTTTTVTTSQSDIVLDVANPDPGARVLAGAYTIEGRAWDATAESGTGIDRVDVFLDSRDAGGIRLGSATTNMADPTMSPESQFANSGWHMTVDLPRTLRGAHMLTFYAHSSVSGGETVMEIPVTIE